MKKIFLLIYFLIAVFILGLQLKIAKQNPYTYLNLPGSLFEETVVSYSIDNYTIVGKNLSIEKAKNISKKAHEFFKNSVKNGYIANADGQKVAVIKNSTTDFTGSELMEQKIDESMPGTYFDPEDYEQQTNLKKVKIGNKTIYVNSGVNENDLKGIEEDIKELPIDKQDFLVYQKDEESPRVAIAPETKKQNVNDIARMQQAMAMPLPYGAPIPSAQAPMVSRQMQKEPMTQSQEENQQINGKNEKQFDVKMLLLVGGILAIIYALLNKAYGKKYETKEKKEQYVKKKKKAISEVKVNDQNGISPSFDIERRDVKKINLNPVFEINLIKTIVSPSSTDVIFKIKNISGTVIKDIKIRGLFDEVKIPRLQSLEEKEVRLRFSLLSKKNSMGISIIFDAILINSRNYSIFNFKIPIKIMKRSLE